MLFWAFSPPAGRRHGPQLGDPVASSSWGLPGWSRGSAAVSPAATWEGVAALASHVFPCFSRGQRLGATVLGLSGPPQGRRAWRPALPPGGLAALREPRCRPGATDSDERVAAGVPIGLHPQGQAGAGFPSQLAVTPLPGPAPLPGFPRGTKPCSRPAHQEPWATPACPQRGESAPGGVSPAPTLPKSGCRRQRSGSLVLPRLWSCGQRSWPGRSQSTAQGVGERRARGSSSPRDPRGKWPLKTLW